MGIKFCKCKNQEIGEVEISPDQIDQTLDQENLNQSNKTKIVVMTPTPTPTIQKNKENDSEHNYNLQIDNSKHIDESGSAKSLRNCKDNYDVKNDIRNIQKNANIQFLNEDDDT